MDPPDVSARMRQQHGLITRAQALAAGMSPRQVDHRLACGAWIRDAAGTYRSAAVPVTFGQRCLAACLHAGDDAVASHLSAAVLHGLAGARVGRPEITVPAGRHHTSPIAVVHRAVSLPRRDRTVVDGIPTTRPARTLVDVAARLTQAEFENMLDDALCRRRATPEAVRAALGRAAVGPGRPGQAALAAALAVWTPGPRPGSPAEMRFARKLVAAGFPLPERQVDVRDRRGRRVAVVDFGYRAERVALEYHGLDGHGPRRQPHDRARENAIVAAGWHLVVATAIDLRPGPSPALTTLTALLGRVRRAG